MSAAEMQQRAEEFRQDYARLQNEIGKVIVGHSEIVHGVLTCLFVGGHALLEGVPRKDLATAAGKLSAGYRLGATSRGLATPADAIAYAVARMPATYAACAAVFARLTEVMPDFAPASLLTRSE